MRGSVEMYWAKRGLQIGFLLPCSAVHPEIFDNTMRGTDTQYGRPSRPISTRARAFNKVPASDPIHSVVYIVETGT